MQENPGISIVNTRKKDLGNILQLFEKTKDLKTVPGYKVWDEIDYVALEKEISNSLQYKLVVQKTMAGIFSVQYSDPLVWGERDKQDAVYLHRIVIDRVFKGQRLFESVLDWAKSQATRLGLHNIRMDTWADNTSLISYYHSFGFQTIDMVITGNDPQLPIQNRNLEIVLLELKV